MKISKNGSLNKIIIHRDPLVWRIFLVCSAIFLLALPIIALVIPLFKNINEILMCVLLLLCMICCAIFIFYDVFRTYVCLDLNAKQLIICNKLKREILSTYGLVNLDVTIIRKSNDFFSLNINYVTYTRNIYSWQFKFTVIFSILSVFNNYQRKRVEKFCAKCNSLLDAKKENI